MHEAPCSGQEAYGRYSDAVMPLLAGVGGRPVFVGLARQSLIAPEGEAWDNAILVEAARAKSATRLCWSIGIGGLR